MPIDNILVDFDHTLFNSPQIKYEWASTMEQCGVPTQIFWGTYPQARYDETGRPKYNPRAHVEMIKDYLNCPPETAISKIQNVMTRARDFLYPDALGFLNRMMSLNVPLTLILHGDEEYEKEKIDAARIEDYFQTLHFSSKDRSEIAKDLALRPEHTIYWISHHMEDMIRVKRAFPFITPIIKRRSDVPLGHYRTLGFLNFDNFVEMQEYLTIIHATSYK